jgi:phenylalanyl-tRNA synthetase beta chain
VRSESERSSHAIRHRLAAHDYQETINYSFVEARWEHELAGNAHPIQVLNPIAAPLSVMRSSLIGGLVAVLRYNLSHKVPRVRVFELGRVFRRDAAVTDGALSVAGIDQPQRVAGLAYGAVNALQWSEPDRPVDFYDVKGDIEALFAPVEVRFVSDAHPALHPGRSAAIEVAGSRVGVVGELHPRWRQAYELPQAPVVFEIELAALTQRAVPAAQPIAKQQASSRDLALVVGERVSHDALVAAVRSADPLVRSVRLFDIYKPAQPTAEIAAGARSMAIRLELLDSESTLTDERIEAAMAAVVARLEGDLGARLRA